jgi:hypothetical protein
MFKNRIRLPFYLSKAQFPTERNVFRKADGSSHVLSAIVRNTYEGTTDQLPEEWHRKLVIALAHKDVSIEGERLTTGVVLDGDYEIDWQEFLRYPIAGANFKVQATPFNASTNNCQSCEEISQLSLVDDYTDEIWDEGTTHDFPDIITANDNICCFPYTIQIVSFNTNYFTSVAVDAAGVLTATVAPIVPEINNVLIATYRVTCPNGAYDEADVYGNLNGTSTECIPPTNLQVVLDPEDGTIAGFTWDEPSPAPAGGYDWFLYLASDIYTPVTTGNNPDGSLGLTGLTIGTDYIFVVTSKCGGGVSVNVTIEFTTPVTGTETCGRFSITHIGGIATAVSYFDCTGNAATVFFLTSGTKIRCMLMDPVTHVPVFFNSTPSPSSYLYIEPC